MDDLVLFYSIISTIRHVIKIDLQFLNVLFSISYYPLLFLELYTELLFHGLPLRSPGLFLLFYGSLALFFVLFRLVTRSRGRS